MITIITATYNSEKFIGNLVQSIVDQSVKNFSWIVVDGGSTDATLDIIQNAEVDIQSLVIVSEPDFGVYDALNKGIALCTSEFYMVVGSDDTLDKYCVEQFQRAALSGDSDVISACIQSDGSKISASGPASSWRKGQAAFISGHSLGCIIKTSLHRELGMYSHKFPIGSDQDFILNCAKNGKKFKQVNFLSGEFNNRDGLSSVDYVGAMCDLFRVQVKYKRSKTIQLLLLNFRLIFGWARW